ncbi:hypothetical protein EV182_004740, partial [Spiromyces aspiralis]
MNWRHVWYDFQVWRVLTSLFYLEVSFYAIFLAILLYRFSRDVEDFVFANRSADYAWFLIFAAFCMIAMQAVRPAYLYYEGVIVAISYLWSRYFSTQSVSFVFGIQVPGIYLPYALIILFFVAKNGAVPVGATQGFISGFVYYYLKHEYPAQGGVDYLETPAL